jgi:hypothetical protein
MELLLNSFINGNETCDEFDLEQKHATRGGEGDYSLFIIFENILFLPSS